MSNSGTGSLFAGYIESKDNIILTKLATLSSPCHFLISGPTAAPARMPQNTSTIIAKPYPLKPPAKRKNKGKNIGVTTFSLIELLVELVCRHYSIN